MNMAVVLILIRKVSMNISSPTQENLLLCSDVKRRRIMFLLKKLTPDMERIHISTIYHFLKGKCPKMVHWFHTRDHQMCFVLSFRIFVVLVDHALKNYSN